MDQTSARPEFGSPAWIDAACRLVEQELSKADLAGVDYVMGEEFLNLPDRLSCDGSSRTGWTIRISDGIVNATPGAPPDDADSVNVVDWNSVERLSHHVFGLDTAKDSEARAMVLRLEGSGKVVRVVRRPQPEALQAAFAPIHNLIVDITGPRRDALAESHSDGLLVEPVNQD